MQGNLPAGMPIGRNVPTTPVYATSPAALHSHTHSAISMMLLQECQGQTALFKGDGTGTACKHNMTSIGPAAVTVHTVCC